MRMAYATARAAVTCVARTLNHLLSLMAWRAPAEDSNDHGDRRGLDCVLESISHKSESVSQTLGNGIHILVATAGKADHQFRAIGQGGTKGFKPGKGVGGFQRWDDPLQPTDQLQGFQRLRIGTAPYSARPISRK